MNGNKSVCMSCARILITHTHTHSHSEEKKIICKFMFSLLVGGCKYLEGLVIYFCCCCFCCCLLCVLLCRFLCILLSIECRRACRICSIRLMESMELRLQRMRRNNKKKHWIVALMEYFHLLFGSYFFCRCCSLCCFKLLLACLLYTLIHLFAAIYDNIVF